MRIISFFAFIFVSTSLLSESHHHAEAIGMDSKSHGLIYGGHVVRRYGAGRFIHRGLQRRAEPAAKDVQDNKGPDDNKNPAPKDLPKAQPKDQNPPKAKDQDPPKAKDPPKDLDPPKVPNPPKDLNPPKDSNPPKDLNPPKDSKDPKGQPPKDPKDPKAPNAKVAAPKNTVDDTTDTTLPKDDPAQNADQDQDPTQGTPTVSTGPISASAVIGLAAVGGVFILVGGLFAFSQRRKNKEMTKSIVSSSAKAWEQQQNSGYEVMEEEAKPIGSYAVIATYTPTLADELDIQPGDTVTILVEYDDGWVQGINETRGGIKGVFPRHCVDMNRIANKVYNKNNKRSSSMGGFTEGYTEVDLS